MKPGDLDMAMRTLALHRDFKLFLLHVVRAANILTPTAGAEQSLQYREGQRSLGLDIIRLAARGLRGGKGTTEQMLSLILASETTPQETDDEDPEPDR